MTDLYIPYFPLPPRGLKKQWSAGGGVSYADAQKHMTNYNRWVKLENANLDFVRVDSPDGAFQWYPKPKNRWLWHPNDGPWLRVNHKYARPKGKILEYPLTLVAAVKDFRSDYDPREYVTPEQIIWASWANFWHDSRVPESHRDVTKGAN